MSYNLMAEGDLDLFELSQLAARYEPLELFPIPAEASSPDAIGIALPSSLVGPPALAALRAVIELLWSKEAAVFDLMTGERIATPDDADALATRITGNAKHED